MDGFDCEPSAFSKGIVEPTTSFSQYCTEFDILDLSTSPQQPLNGYVGNTDYDWYQFLSRRDRLDEVNFWRPGGGRAFKVLKSGEPFFFKLKAAHGHHIVGFGLFAMFRPLSVMDAWQLFSEANGASSLPQMLARVSKYTGGGTGLNHAVGCVLLSTPVFFPRELWIRPPSDWARNIVSGKGYNLQQGEGRRIWGDCLERLVSLPSISSEPDTIQAGILVDQLSQSDGYEVKPRLGQGLFRLSVTDAYGRCAVSGEHSLPALDAAHIKPWSEGGPHDVTNGLLLRADIHRLFDRGYVTITPDHRFKVSSRLHEEYHNGKAYYQADGSKILSPTDPELIPNPVFLEYHNAEVFLG